MYHDCLLIVRRAKVHKNSLPRADDDITSWIINRNMSHNITYLIFKAQFMKLEIGHDLHVFNDIFYPGIFVCWLLNSENKQFCDTLFLQQYDFREVKKFQGIGNHPLLLRWAELARVTFNYHFNYLPHCLLQPTSHYIHTVVNDLFCQCQLQHCKTPIKCQVQIKC